MTFTVIRILSIIIGIVGTTYIIPIITAIYCGEFQILPSFIIPMISSWILALIFIFAGRKKKSSLSIRASFSVVALAWICISSFGAVPLYFSGAIPNWTNAFFESASGFTTTGATILEEIETLPRSINLFRCLTHWLGGMGIVALTVALLPILGVGGFQLIKAETTGPEKGKLTTKITNTAKALWFIYFGFTVIETILLKLAGMDFIDALSHAFSTLGTGGFSTRNSSIAFYDSKLIDWICFTFMFLSGINFSLYYYLFAKKFNEISSNTELKAYIGVNIIAILLITIFETSTYGGFFKSLRYSAFQVSSICSSTGFATADYTLWHSTSQSIIFALLFIGGSSGSTAGGVKVIRWVILGKQLHNEILKTIHPHGIYSIRLDNKPGRKDIVFTVTAFFALYFFVMIFTTFFGAFFGMDIFTSFTGAVTMLGNVGPAFNLLGPSCNYQWLAAPVKWWYSIVMIAGRLELFTIFIFLSRSFWKK